MKMVSYAQAFSRNRMGKSHGTSNSPKIILLMGRDVDFSHSYLSRRSFITGSSSTEVQGAHVMSLASLEDGRNFTSGERNFWNFWECRLRRMKQWC